MRNMEMNFVILTSLYFITICGSVEATKNAEIDASAIGAACALPIKTSTHKTESQTSNKSAFIDLENKELANFGADPYRQCQVKLEYLIAKFKQLPVFKRLDYVEDFSSKSSSGNFGTVKFYRELTTGRKVAIKQMLCEDANPEEELQEQIRFLGVLESVSEEIDILREITTQNVPYVTQFCGAFIPQNVLGVYIAMSRVRGKDLRSVILEMADVSKRFTIRSIALIAAQLALALAHLHRLNIVHKDVKHDNVVVDYEIIYDPIDVVTTYHAKNAVDDVTIGTPVDIWALGLVLYAMIIGDDISPFDHECDRNCAKKTGHTPRKEMFHNIEEKKVDYPEGKFSYEEMDLLDKMLTKDPAKRITAVQILKHPWFAANAISVPRLEKIAELERTVEAKNPEWAHFEKVSKISEQKRRDSNRKRRPPLPRRRGNSTASSSSSSLSSYSTSYSSSASSRQKSVMRRRTSKRTSTRDEKKTESTKDAEKKAESAKEPIANGFGNVGLNFTRLWNETIPKYKPTAELGKTIINNLSTSMEKIAKYANKNIRYRI